MSFQDVAGGPAPVGSEGPSAASGTDVARGEAAQVAGAAKDQASAVAGSAVQSGQQVAAEAKHQVGQVAGEIRGQLHGLVEQSRAELGEQASSQTARAATNLHTLSEQIAALAEGRPGDAGGLGDYLSQGGEKIAGYARRLEEGGFDGVVRDAGRFARRRPGLFLLGAAAAGFVAGRLIRGAQASSGGSRDPVSESKVDEPTALPSVGSPALLPATQPSEGVPPAELTGTADLGTEAGPRRPRGELMASRLPPEHSTEVDRGPGASVAADKSLGELFSAMTSELGNLVHQEIELAKIETKDEVSRAAKAAGMFVGAAVCAHMGWLFVSLGLAWLLDQWINRALAFAIVGVLYAVVAAVLLSVGRTRAKQIDPVPRQTVETLKEDVKWAKAQKS